VTHTSQLLRHPQFKETAPSQLAGDAFPQPDVNALELSPHNHVDEDIAIKFSH
jgi:hypothetical protein